MSALFDEIKALPCFTKIDCQLSPIAGGESHCCFKVTLQESGIEKSYFVKSLCDHQTTASAEVASSIVAGEAQLAPAVIYHSPLWLVTDFIDGQSLQEFTTNNSAFSSDESISLVMSLMVSTHKLLGSDKHSVINVIELLNDQINQPCFTKKQQVSLAKVISEVANFQLFDNHLVLCHGDINYENIRLSHTFEQSQLTKQAWLVDFECSGLAEPEYDAAMYMAINLLPHENIDHVISYYQQYSAVTLNDKKLRCYLACCYLINGLWYVEKAGKSEQANAFLAKARQQFIFFDRLELFKEKMTQLA